jgi:maltose alpha-D-glucosyltransferase/alpha-amylase
MPFGAVAMVVARAEYTDGESDTFALPLATHTKGSLATVAHIAVGANTVFLVDALEEAAKAKDVLEAIARAATPAPAAKGNERPSSSPRLGRSEVRARALAPLMIDPALEARVIVGPHPSTAVRFGDRHLLKFFRALEEGTNPEVEIGQHLRRVQGGAPHVPRLEAFAEYARARGEPSALAVVQEFVPNEGTAWGLARVEVGRFYERALTLLRDQEAPRPPARADFVAMAAAAPPPVIAEAMGTFREMAGLLGRRTGELHLALADSEDPAFVPEPYSPLDQRSLYQSMRNLVGRVLRQLKTQAGMLPPEARGLADVVVASEAVILRHFEPLLTKRLTSLRMRCHGDLHLDQALYTGKDFVLIDFDGGREHALPERRRKRSPLRDVASMLRSFEVVAHDALLDQSIVREGDRAIVIGWMRAWQAWSCAAFLGGYLEVAGRAPFVPAEPAQLGILLDTFVLAKAFRELEGGLRARSMLARIALEGVADALGLAAPGEPPRGNA